MYTREWRNSLESPCIPLGLGSETQNDDASAISFLLRVSSELNAMPATKRLTNARKFLECDWTAEADGP